MANYVQGPKTLAREDDEAGHRTREVLYLVHRDTTTDGPDEALTTAGLPTFGDSYVDGLGHTDPWCFCTQYKSVRRHQVESERGHWWAVTRRFTTVPAKGRCKGEEVQHPLDVLPEVNVKTVRFTEEGMVDRFGYPILTSSHEFIRGPQNEWELSHLQIRIKCAVSDPQTPALCQMKDTVNAFAIWGFPPRTVKLSEFELDARFMGNCAEYADRLLVFDVRFRARDGVMNHVTGTGTGTEVIRTLLESDDYETWDRYVIDEGTKCIKGNYNKAGVFTPETIGGAQPDPLNPSHFTVWKDRNGNTGRVLLDGEGRPASTFLTGASGTGTKFTGDAGRTFIEYYGESDFSLLERLPTGIFPLVM